MRQLRLVACALLLTFTAPIIQAGSLWYATDNRVLQLDNTTHQTLATINLSKVKALAVSAADDSVFALTESKLYRYSGSLKLWEKKLTDLGLSKGKLLAADPSDGSIWLASDKILVHLDPLGNKLHGWSSEGKVKRLLVDPSHSLWLMGESAIWHYAVDGVLQRKRELGSALDEPQRFALDSKNKYLWVAGKTQLARFDTALLQSPVVVTLPDETEDIALDPLSGALWVLNEERLLAYDTQAVRFYDKRLKSIGLPETESEKIAYEPQGKNLWLAYEEGLAKLGMDGILQATVTINAEVKELGVVPYYVTATPVLSMIQPVPGALVNTATPTFILGYNAPCSGTPCLYTPYSLTANLNNQAVGQDFVFDTATGNSEYTPSSPLPEGKTTLTAQATNAEGGVSNYLDESFTVDTIAPRFIGVTPANGTIFQVAEITIAGSVDDPDASVVLNNYHGSGTNPAVQNFSFPVTLAQGENIFDLSAIDNAGNSAQLRLNYTYALTTNAPPSISMVSPTNGAIFGAPAAVTLSALASDTDGTIATVEFLQGTAVIANLAAAPYTFLWNNVAAGSYSLTARATDNGGAVTVSAPVSISVIYNEVPTVILSTPQDGTLLPPLSTLTLSAEASDPDGTISKVEFYQDTNLVGTVNAAPYTLTLASVLEGTYVYTAKAYDNLGASATSAPATVTFGSNLGLTLIHPAEGATIDDNRVTVSGTFLAPANTGITVNGVAAAIVGDTFYAIDVPVQAGANLLTAVLTTHSGATLTQTRNINGGVVPPIRIDVEPSAGIAPMTAVFTLSGVTGAYTSNLSNAGGTLDTSDPGVLFKIGYSTPGVYRPVVTVTDSTGVTATHEFTLVVQDPAALDALLKAQWDGMNQALIAGDKTTAMTYLNTQAQAKYGPVFDVLMPYMGEIVATYSPLRQISLTSELGEYALIRAHDGANRVFFIYLLQDPNGVWRIDGM